MYVLCVYRGIYFKISTSYIVLFIYYIHCFRFYFDVWLHFILMPRRYRCVHVCVYVCREKLNQEMHIMYYMYYIPIDDILICMKKIQDSNRHSDEDITVIIVHE